MVSLLYFCKQESNLLDDMLPTIISTFFVVLIFVFGHWLDSKIRKGNIKREWYFRVIIEPNISKIDKFIDNVFITLNNSIDVLIISKTSDTYEVYLDKKSLEFGEFQKMKRLFEFDVLSFIKANNPEIQYNLTKFLLDLEDSTTNILDSENLKEDDIELIENEIRKYKTELLILLYKPLKN